MSLLDQPIPPRPAYFGPDGSPPGVELALDSYATLDDGFEWLAARPRATPRLAVIHTNAASYESTTAAQVSWGKRSRNNTKPHYVVGDKPMKVLATNRRSIANSTAPWVEDAYGEPDVSYWSISIETADLGSIRALERGYHWPVDCGPFLSRPDGPDDDEIVARILAYESIVWDFPLAIPEVWNGSGVVTHTWPFPYPHYTTVLGKTCPGDTKINAVRGEVLQRAIDIRDAWTNTKESPVTEFILKPNPEFPEFPWLYVYGADVRYAVKADVDSGADVITDDKAERYANLFFQVFGVTVNDVSMIDGVVVPN